ncbi:MAG: hypothetical protein WCH62_03670 [Candidatus Omnitrophota bacterium]
MIMELRKKFFNLVCRNCSPDFIEYIRVYETLPKPPQESFEISCELINGIRVDSMRLAIMRLYRQDVLRWISACHHKISFLQDLLYENTTDECFGIGLADYPSGLGICRIKIYNTYGRFQSQKRKSTHIQQSFSVLNIPDVEFRKDWERFKKVEFSGIDWDREGRAMIKVYFGPFRLEQLFGNFSEVLLKEDILCYDILRQKGLLPEKFLFCVRYFQGARSIRTDMRFQTRRIVPYLRIFDHQREASKLFVDFYRIFPGSRLEYISMQWAPILKQQFYFWVR